MYLLIPLVLILASAIGIFVIIWRKVPYLRKLSVADIQPSPGIWADLFPELSEGLNSDRLKHYRLVWLSELEKFLRRLRLISLKIDRMSDSMIKKIRNFTERKHESLREDMKPVRSLARAKSAGPKDLGETTSNGMKMEEQKLIIEIAKNPKNPDLYEVLGDLYMKMAGYTDAKEAYEAAIGLAPSKEELKVKHSQAAEKVL